MDNANGLTNLTHPFERLGHKNFVKIGQQSAFVQISARIEAVTDTGFTLDVTFACCRLNLLAQASNEDTEVLSLVP